MLGVFPRVDAIVAGTRVEHDRALLARRAGTLKVLPPVPPLTVSDARALGWK